MNKEELTLNTILNMVCTYYGIATDNVKSRCRLRQLVDARQLYARLARLYTPSTWRAIGSVINRDHSTIIHSYNKISELAEIDKKTAYDIRTVITLNPELGDPCIRWY